MSLPSDTATLELPLLVENDLEVDNDGRMFVVSYRRQGPGASGT